ncbi:MAG: 16S rRNA (guanine(527)-N(7))-methyltransferase RsmG [Clostridia bacterium]|nr:16S rRNA (guanine(527)-N(7))-methyltransferase RsmG [Clostridia bacterium]
MNSQSTEFIDTLIKGFEYYKYSIPQNKIDKLTLFNNLVMATNEHTNLTSIEDGASSAKRHFLDSLNPEALQIIKSANNVIDVGSGAGFPGIPLAVMHDEVRFTLLDTRKKRCEFMQEAVKQLNLKNVTVLWGRAEDYGKDTSYREKYDIACARALATVPVLLEYLSPFLSVGGAAMLYKGSSPEEEISSAKNALSALGMGEINTFLYSVYGDTSEYSMLCSVKINTTPDKYPRKAGIALKRPL